MIDNKHDVYSNPLITRYASEEMSRIFSDTTKYTTWRKLWYELAKAQKTLGLTISNEQLQEMETHIHDLNIEKAEEYEKQMKHDVMAHIHAYGEQCPSAKSIIHLGATSAYVNDNTDLIQMRDGLINLKNKVVNVIRNLKLFAIDYKSFPTLGFTHFQPAQLTTIGKRASLWLQDFVIDYHDITYVLSSLRFRGVKGTTGTQASFLSLFDGNHDKVKKLDDMVSKAFGFSGSFIVTGQTYTRKQDVRIASCMSGVCQSATKMSNDFRLLAHLKEIEEPFGSSQVGSSAMPYKRNPIFSERMASLARFVMSLESSPVITQSSQWFERTLDDSANKRLSLPQMFLGTDAVLRILLFVTSGIVVYPQVIRKHIDEELPFIASENILMQGVKRGGDRQVLHEELRRLSQEVGMQIKCDGARNDLIEKIKESKLFNLTDHDIAHIIDPQHYIGRAPQQVEDFIATEVDPILQKEQTCPVETINLDV
jgi:adenylosuccinate lyase